MHTKALFPSFLLLLTLLQSTTGCSGKQVKPDSIPLSAGEPIPYQLRQPNRIIALKDSFLQEISGLGTLSIPGQLCAISDERGEIYLLTVKEELVIEKTIPFREKGDFEGVECVGDTLFALQSNGKLYELTNWVSGTPSVRQYQTGLDKSHDLEGLGYDPNNNRLLLACKEDPASNVPRTIWAFELATRSLNPQPVYTLDPNQINAQLGLPPKEKNKYLSPSGIAVHPISSNVYILSSALRCLVVLNPTSGQVVSVELLDKQLFPQPEGIAFEKNGDLWISSEGKKGTASLQLFSYQSQ